MLNNAQRVHIGWRVARHQLADAVIRRTNAVLLAQIGQTVVLQGEIQPRFLVHIECVEQVVQAAMVDVRMLSLIHIYGEVCTMRGKKMRDGDYAEYNGGRYTVKVEE